MIIGKYYLLTLFLSLSLNTICQETAPRNRISINMLSYMFINKSLDYIYSDNSFNFLNGLVYNRNYNRVVTRYSLNFIWGKKEIPWRGPDSYAGNEYHYVGSFNTGIQKEYSIRKFDAFFGMDLYYNIVVQKHDLHGGAEGGHYVSKVCDNWLGISPITGIRYTISTHFSIAVESSYNIEYNIFSTRAKSDPQLVNNLNYLNPVNALYLEYSF